MTADVINLNKARKARGKQTAKAQAATNRAQFGRSKTERALDKARAEKADRALDGAKREPEDQG
jgi:hypothetical protein